MPDAANRIEVTMETLLDSVKNIDAMGPVAQGVDVMGHHQDGDFILLVQIREEREDALFRDGINPRRDMQINHVLRVHMIMLPPAHARADDACDEERQAEQPASRVERQNHEQ